MSNQEPYFTRNPSAGAHWGFQPPPREHPSRFQSDVPTPWSSRPRPIPADTIPYDCIPLREVRVPVTSPPQMGVDSFPRSEGVHFYQPNTGFEKSLDNINGSGAVHLSTLAPLTAAAAATGIPLADARASSFGNSYDASHLFGPASVESPGLKPKAVPTTTASNPSAQLPDGSAVPRWLRYAAFGLVGITAVGLAFRLYRDHCAQTAKLRGQQIAEAEKLRTATTVHSPSAAHSPAKFTAQGENPFPSAATSNWIDCDGGEEIHPYTPRWDRASSSDLTSPTKERDGAFNDWDVVPTHMTSSGASRASPLHRAPRTDAAAFVITSSGESSAEEPTEHSNFGSHRLTSPVSIPNVGIVTTAFHELTQDEVGSLTSTDDPRGSVGGGSMTTAAGLSAVTSPALKPTPASSASHHQETDGDSFTWLPSAMYA